jgi:uncharacterized delta-60 repeat protein
MKAHHNLALMKLITKPWRPLLGMLVASVSMLLVNAAGAALAGQLDPSFGTGGKAQLDFGGGRSDYGHGLALQADGKIVIVGYSGVYPEANSAVARLNNDGSPDNSFGSGGSVISVFSTTDGLEAVAVQSDGRIVAVGWAAVTSGNNGTEVLVARYNSDGTLDTSFGANGAVMTNLRSHIPDYWFFTASAEDVALLADGKILVAAQTTTVSFGRMALLRYNSDGTLDQTFGEKGVTTIEFHVQNPNGGATAVALALQADGKAVLGGYVSDYSFSNFALARVNADGSLDSTFGNNGEVTTVIGSGDALVNDVAVQADGKIVAAGSFEAADDNHDFALARYSSNGTLDRTFGRKGKETDDLFGSTDDFIRGIVLQADGKIIAVGETGHYPAFNFAVARYTTAGRLDPTFGQRGKVQTDFGSGSFDVAYDVALASDGKIVVAGETNAGSIQDFDFAATRYLNP